MKKEVLMQSPLLMLPNGSKEFQLFTHAILCVLDAMLEYDCKTIAYASRTLNAVKMNHAITEKYSLAEV